MRWKTSKTAREIAVAIQAELRGDPERVLIEIATLDKATQDSLSFCTNKQYRQQLRDTKAGLVVLAKEELDYCTQDALIMENPRMGLVRVAEWLKSETAWVPGIHPTACIGKGVVVPTSAWVGPYATIGEGSVLGEHVAVFPHVVIGEGCEIGDNTVIRSHVTLYDRVKIGARTLIHSGAVLGSDGFGFAVDAQGQWKKMPHFGSVTIGDDVEIGANTTIDAGFLEPTLIEDGVIIDNLVQVGHNVSIGKRTAIAGCVAIAGSVKIGQSCLIGGGSSIAGHIELADKVHVTGTSAVNRSLKQPGVYSSGFPARPNKQWRKNVARFQQLDEMARRLIRLEKGASSNAHSPEESESSC
jgi:UDP-3-O-[3-hydroxymyristoyl] glucosamine N-acyltransferase